MGLSVFVRYLPITYGDDISRMQPKNDLFSLSPPFSRNKK